MNIGIVGPGAIGSLWAIKLSQAGHNVALYSRKIDSQLSITLDQQQPVVFTNNNRQLLNQCDLIIVTVKAWQVESAITPLLTSLHPDTILMFMHNGMGAIDTLSNDIHHFPIVLATTTQAAFKPSPESVLHTGQGSTQLGSYNVLGAQCSFLCDVLNHALPEVKWNQSIQEALWQKLAINCAINPLTGLNQIKNGQLAEAKYQEELQPLITELEAVMTAEGIPTSKRELQETINHVIHATAQNNSSMKQDMLYHRPTEIDFITGYLLTTAAKHNIDVPKNLALYKRVKQAEQY
ncbi:2-dehydropantoate 2-reductase [Vibrio gallaecicus]|uniref:2-dehydropantoate 2-reductase n=1 Tax=Vibrio gallaecicus TaxID=552386 RepID=A0ABV4NF40_9VIBR